MFRGQIDLLIGIEWNKDVDYFSNISESISRDLFIYVVQVNDSEKGDTRIIAPKRNYLKNVVNITGGENACLIVGSIDVKNIRKFSDKQTVKDVRKEKGKIDFRNSSYKEKNKVKELLDYSAPSSNFDKKIN